MRKRLIVSFLLCALLLLSACSAKNELPDLSEMGEIVAISRESGSGTREVFQTMIGTDASDGLNKAIRGECDFAMSSRELADYENELLSKKAVARDGIAVIVNADNPVTSLSKEQIKQIYDNKAAQWSDLK